MAADGILKLRARLGRPCPRVELDAEDGLAIELVASLQLRTQHPFQPMYEAAAAGLSPEEKRGCSIGWSGS